MDVVYLPPPSYPPRYGGSTMRRTQSTDDEVGRILNWNYNVATSSPPSAAVSPRARLGPLLPGCGEPCRVLRRSVTTTSILYEPHSSAPPASNEFSTGTVVGTLLGVAAGAAAGAVLTYGMLKSEGAHVSYRDSGPQSTSRRRVTLPEPSLGGRDRFVEAGHRGEMDRRHHEYPPSSSANRRVPPQYLIPYGRPASGGPSHGLVDAYYDDGRSRSSSRYAPPSSSGRRARSAAPPVREPLLLMDTEHRSLAGSRRGESSRARFDAADGESYTSARSQRTATTIKGPAASQPATTQVLSRSRTGRRVTTTTVNTPSRTASRDQTYVSARNMPLPASRVGSSHAGWDDDANSVAPSDSISCVGSRPRGRPYH